MGYREGRPMSKTQQLILDWSPASNRDLQRLRDFLKKKNPNAARRTAQKIRNTAQLILENPAIGYRLENRNDREFSTPFGKDGYIIRYRVIDNTIVILKIWHTRETRSIN